MGKAKINKIAFIRSTGRYADKELVPVDYIFIERLSNKAGDFDWYLPPHLHSHLFQVFFIKKGNADIQVNGRRYTLQAPFMVYIPPNNIHELHLEENSNGYLISFTYVHIEQILTQKTAAALYLSDIHIADKLSDNFIDAEFKILSVLQNEQNNGGMATQLKDYLLGSALLLLGKIKEHYTFQSNNITDLDFDLFKKFKFLAREKFHSITIENYAQELFVTSQKLKNTCRQIANEAPVKIINNLLIEKAKTLLINTDFTIQQIAIELGIKDGSYLNRMFKKIVGINIAQFRKNKCNRS